MSDEKDEPRTAEIVKSEAGKVTRIEPAPIGIMPRLSRFLFRARHDKELYKAHAEVIEAKTRVGQAYEGLERTAGRLVDLDNILATDKAQRDAERLEAEKARLTLRKEVEDIAVQQRREARLSEREDEVRQAEMELELEERLAAIKAKRKRLQEAETRVEKDEETLRREAVRKNIRRKLSDIYTVRELRAEEEQLIAEVRKRHGGVLTPDAEREIQNIKDAVQQLIDEL